MQVKNKPFQFICAAVMFAFALLLLIAIPLRTNAQPGLVLHTVDWETDNDGDPIAAGQVIDDEFSGGDPTLLQFTISATTNIVNHDRAIIFPSHAPTSGDLDLGSPNTACTPSGPGVGADGEPGDPGENCLALNNVLILPQNITDNNGDLLVDVPNDSNFGGTIIIQFDDVVNGIALTVLDQDDSTDAIVNTYDPGNVLISSNATNGYGDNSKDRIVLTGAENIDRIEVVFDGSGAISSFEVEQEQGMLAITLDNLQFSQNYSIFLWLAIVAILLVSATFLARRAYFKHN